MHVDVLFYLPRAKPLLFAALWSRSKVSERRGKEGQEGARTASA